MNYIPRDVIEGGIKSLLATYCDHHNLCPEQFNCILQMPDFSSRADYLLNIRRNDIISVRPLYFSKGCHVPDVVAQAFVEIMDELCDVVWPNLLERKVA